MNSEFENPRIKIPQGILEGFVLRSRKNKEYYGFYGLEFARAERFELPKKWESWNGVLKANRAKERCIQVNQANKQIIGSETCHFLNVFTPKFKIKNPDDLKGLPAEAPIERYPVIVFLHGGGFLAGGSDLYGNKFLVDEDIILVTVNYRLGALGFLNLGDGIANLGLHDQVMALHWVQSNIEYFAGDKRNVTLMGESAGAACVHYHCMSPLSSGLFSKAIMQSGSVLCPWAFNHAPAEKLKKLLKQLDINGFSHHNKTEILTKLRRLDARAIAAQRVDFETVKDNIPVIHFAPSIESGPASDKKFLTESPVNLLYTGKIINEVPLIIGLNEQEGLYRSLPILRDVSRVRALNEHWSNELPQHLMYKKDNVSQQIGQSIRKYYFDSKPILFPESADARERLTNMLSDRLFIYPIRKTVQIHARTHSNPDNKIFLYNFKYTGEYSFSNGFEGGETYGASHADELQYLMNQRIFYSKITPGCEADEMIDKMIGLWGGFARTGVPSYNRQTRPWTPVPFKPDGKNEALEYFCIDINDGMIPEPFTERMDFWDHIPDLSLTF